MVYERQEPHDRQKARQYEVLSWTKDNMAEAERQVHVAIYAAAVDI
jgi:hypothetical protein